MEGYSRGKLILKLAQNMSGDYKVCQSTNGNKEQIVANSINTAQSSLALSISAQSSSVHSTPAPPGLSQPNPLQQNEAQSSSSQPSSTHDIPSQSCENINPCSADNATQNSNIKCTSLINLSSASTEIVIAEKDTSCKQTTDQNREKPTTDNISTSKVLAETGNNRCCNSNRNIRTFAESESSNADYTSDDSVADPHFTCSTSSSEPVSSSETEDEIEEKENEDRAGGIKRTGMHECTDKDKKRRKVTAPSENIKKGRKRIGDSKTWKKSVAKQLRNSGKSYISTGRKKKTFEAKTLLPPCTESCKLKCFTKITEDDRKIIFSKYWELESLQRQRDFLAASMASINPKYRYVRENSHRRQNNAFHFEFGGKTIRVCKRFFKSTLAINDRPIRTVIEKKEGSFTGQMIAPDLRGKHKNHARVDEKIKESVRNHIRSIPKIESHYCRADTTREFIEGGKTITDLHRDYLEICREKNVASANYVMYSRIFNEEFNLSFFVPKKDQCELCIAFKNGNNKEKTSLQEVYDTHLKEKDLSRLEKQNDKNSNNHVAVYDLQAVLPCPRGNASSFYYVSKLNVLNFTIFDLKTKDVQCYVWHEGQAHRGANEIGSSVFRYLEDVNANATSENKTIDVIFYSDNCAGQQKNRFMIAMYMYSVLHLQYINSITHKYFITGHTQNEGDSAHSVIERQVKKSLRAGPICVPEQYVTLIRTAKKNGNPYQVNELCYEDFYDLRDLANELGCNNLSKNINGETVKLSEAKIIMLQKASPGQVFYKNSYEQMEFDIISVKNPRRKGIGKIQKNILLKKAYQRKPGITDKKKASLLSLFKTTKNTKQIKNTIPKVYQEYYNNL